MAEEEACLSPVLSRYGTGADSEGELWVSLARAKTRSYGSTASVAATLEERYISHRVAEGDTLQGIALRYGVTMEQIKRANKLFSNDCIFLRHSLNIPVQTERPLFNGLSLESPDRDDDAPLEPPQFSCMPSSSLPYSPSPPVPDPLETNVRPPPPDELSAKDYLQMLDLQITRSKQAARKLKDEEDREDEDTTRPASSYQEN